MIASVDTGMKNFGIAIINGNDDSVVYVETIRTRKTKDKKAVVAHDYKGRIITIYRRLNEIIHEYKVTGITGELPTFGSQSAAGALSPALGTAIILSLAESRNLPTAWCSPRELKLLFTKNPEAKKEEIMVKACTMYNWEITYKDVRDKVTREIIRQDPEYHVRGLTLGKNKFEHIADAIAAYHACKALAIQRREKCIE